MTSSGISRTGSKGRIPDHHSIALIGRYRIPRYRYGEIVADAIRGDVVIVRTSDAPTPWPIGKIPGSRKPGLIVFAGLLDALRTESAVAVCHHWGVTTQTVSKWRGLLGIDQKTPGALRFRQQRLTGHLNAARSLIDYNASERVQKIAAARTGKPRPRHVMETMRAANAKRGWTATDDHAIRTLSPAEAAQVTGRTMHAVYGRSHVLGMTDGSVTRSAKPGK